MQAGEGMQDVNMASGFGQPPGGPPPGGGGFGQPPGGGGYPPGGGAPPGGGGYGQPPGGQPPGGGGFGQPPGQPPGGGFGQPPGGAPPGGGGFGQPPGGGFGGGPSIGEAHPWSPTEALGFAWDRVKNDPATILGALIVGQIIIAAPGQLMGFVGQAIVGSMDDPDTAGLVLMVVNLLSQIITLCVQAFMTGGMVSLALKVARGESYSFGEIFSGGQYFLSMLGATILQAIAVGIGMVLCVVPGIILALGLAVFSMCLVDQKLGAIDSLKKSWEITNGHKMNIFVFFLLMIGVAILGLLACCVGILVVQPLQMVAMAWIYLKLTGQQTAATGG